MIGDECVKIPKPKLGRGMGVFGKVVNNHACPYGFKHNDINGVGWCSKDGKTQKEILVPINPYPDYSISPGVSEVIKKGINTGWEKCGLFYYPKCPSGMIKTGCNICTTEDVPLACEDSEAYEIIGTDCYIKCPIGYERNADKLCVYKT
jgi:hypothetical protein